MYDILIAGCALYMVVASLMIILLFIRRSQSETMVDENLFLKGVLRDQQEEIHRLNSKLLNLRTDEGTLKYSKQLVDTRIRQIIDRLKHNAERPDECNRTAFILGTLALQIEADQKDLSRFEEVIDRDNEGFPEDEEQGCLFP